MSYFALSLKYRPKNFGEVVGQENVVISLKNAILKKRLHHAYLFSGPRGVGKTSLARIFSRSLNCKNGPTVTPCEKCLSCQETLKGKCFDVIEIDAASNRGIDDVRVLRENIKLSPTYCRYKIYIIDEVHMLSQDAANALLKTLEEPPPHAKFIFATTHPQKILPTVLSRCQKFQFTLLPTEKIVFKLKTILKGENINIDEHLLFSIARAAEGSIRDAESLMDQIIPVVLEGGSPEELFSFLGIMGEEALNKALTLIVKKDAKGFIQFLTHLAQEGKDIGVFLNAFIEHTRNLLLASLSRKNFYELSDLSLSSKDLIIKLSSSCDLAEIIHLLDYLIEAYVLSRKINNVRIPLELAAIKFSLNLKKEKEKNTIGQNNLSLKIENKIDDYQSEISPNDSDNISGRDLLEDLERSLSEGEKSSSLSGKDISEKKHLKNNLEGLSEVPHREDNFLKEILEAKWQEIILHIQKKRAAIAAHLSYARPLTSFKNKVTLALAKENYFHREILEENKNRKFLEGVFSFFLGEKISLRFTFSEVLNTSESGAAGSHIKKGLSAENNREENAVEEEENSSDNSFIDDILDTFGGSLHTK